MRQTHPSPLWTWLRRALLAVLTLLFLLPFYVIVRNAFSSQRWITAPRWHWLPDRLGLENLRTIFANPDVGLAQAMWTSTVVAVVQTAGTLVVSLLAGYALARYSNRAARALLALTVFTLMVPATATFLPSFVMMAALRWIGTWQALIVPGMFSAFATYMFRQSFVDFPVELEEAAEIDGANPWTAFWRIVVPNSMGIIGAVGTITFIGAWNAFLWPMLVGREHKTVQVAISQFMTSQNVRFPELFAGALVAVVPVVVVFLFLQRFLVQGVETSGMK